MSVLTVSRLSVKHGGRALIDGISFSVCRGEVLGILGQSGSGKSLTALAIMGLLPAGMSADGSIVLNGREVIGTSERILNTIRGSAAIVFQEPSAALDPLMKISKQIALPLKKHGVRGAALNDAVLNLLRKARLADAERIARSYPHEISGGERQRASIALAFACSPSLLIADEPTSSADAHSQKQLVDIIAALARESGTAVLFISHDIAIVKSIAARIVVMKDGRIVEDADAHSLTHNPRHPYTQRLLQSARELEDALAGILHG
jgi:ABC-type glutathione transport system ATPase component